MSPTTNKSKIKKNSKKKMHYWFKNNDTVMLGVGKEGVSYQKSYPV